MEERTINMKGASTPFDTWGVMVKTTREQFVQNLLFSGGTNFPFHLKPTGSTL